MALYRLPALPTDDCLAFSGLLSLVAFAILMIDEPLMTALGFDGCCCGDGVLGRSRSEADVLFPCLPSLPHSLRQM
jgi:hypothetical protein